MSNVILKEEANISLFYKDGCSVIIPVTRQLTYFIVLVSHRRQSNLWALKSTEAHSNTLIGYDILKSAHFKRVLFKRTISIWELVIFQLAAFDLKVKLFNVQLETRQKEDSFTLYIKLTFYQYRQISQYVHWAVNNIRKLMEHKWLFNDYIFFLSDFLKLILWWNQFDFCF